MKNKSKCQLRVLFLLVIELTLLIVCMIIGVRAIVFEPDVFKGYRVIEISGDERYMFDVEINNFEICLIPKFENFLIVDEGNKEIGEVKERAIFMPTEINVKDHDEVLKEQIAKSKNNQFCYTSGNPYTERILKFGEHTIVIEGDFKYNSTDVNVSQNNDFTHLNVSGSDIYEDLMLYLNMDDNKTDFVRDLSDNSYSATVNSTKYNSSGYIGGSYYFDGNADRLCVYPDRILFNGTDFYNISVSVWLYLRGTCNSGDVVVGNRLNNDYGWALRFSSDCHYLASVNTIDTDDEGGLSADKWYHLACVYDFDSNISCYLNGSLDSHSVGIGNESNNGSGNVIIGGGEYIDSFDLWGLIDELMIFNRSLTGSEIQNIYNNQSSRFMNKGSQTFSLTTGNAYRANISLDGCQKYQKSNLSIKIGSGVETYFDNCLIENYEVNPSEDPQNLVINYYSDSNNFYSPAVIGNITVNLFEAAQGEIIGLSESSPVNSPDVVDVIEDKVENVKTDFVTGMGNFIRTYPLQIFLGITVLLYVGAFKAK